MTDIPHLIHMNSVRWKRCHIVADKVKEVTNVAERLVRAKPRYLPIERETDVPWWVIAIIHEREADQNFKCSLAQGDPWDKVSTHVPRGRGPFSSFEASAVDALVKCAPFAARWKDWSVGGALTLLELYNGTGYEDKHHEASPYIWAATNLQEWGKYTSDGHWNSHVWDTQLGCAAILKAMIIADPTIQPEEG